MMLIPTSKNTRNITDFRKDPDSILEAVQGKSDPLYLFRGSTPKAVVLDIEAFVKFQEMLEDYQDSLLAQEYATRSRSDLVPFDKILKDWKVEIPGRKDKNLKK